MSHSLLHPSQRHAEYEGSTRFVEVGSEPDSFIRAYEITHAQAVPSHDVSEATSEFEFLWGTSHIKSAYCLCPTGVVGQWRVIITTTELNSAESITGSSEPLGWFEHTYLQTNRNVLTLHDRAVQANALLEWETFKPEVPEPDRMWAEAIERLKAFRTLKPNWNGYDAVVPTKKAIDECLAFAKTLRGVARSPVAMVSGQGEVGLLWERDEDGALVEIGFRGDGAYGYLAVLPSGSSSESENIPVETDRPAALVEALNVFCKN